MNKIVDFYLVIIISINMLMALTIVCAPYSSMMAIEDLLANHEELNTPTSLAPLEPIKQIQLIGKPSGTIEFNR